MARLLQRLGRSAAARPRRPAGASRRGVEQLASLLTQIPAIVWAVDRELRLTQVFGGGIAPFGTTENESVGRTLDEFIPTEAEALDAHRRALEGEASSYELEYQERILAAYVEPLREGDRVVGAIGVAFDTTERAHAERELSAAEARFRALVENAAEMVISVDRSGRVLDVNRATSEIVGLPAAEICGRSVLDFVVPEHHDIVETEMRRKLQGTSERSFYSVDIVVQDGTRVPLEITSALVREPNADDWLLAVARDVREQRALQERLGQVQRLESVGRLAGGVAHDFNNLLTAIEGYTHFTIDALTPDQSHLRDNLNEVLTAAGRAASLTRQLLAFSRRQVLQPRVFDLAPLVTDMQRLLARLIGEDIDLRVQGGEGCPVLADPGQVEQALVNLVLNARDAMPGGGAMTVEVAHADVDRRRADILQVKAGAYVRLSVADTGGGMDDETKARIFEPFFTTKDRALAAGMGLATVYGIVRQSGGGIAVESEPGSGTTVSIFLPVAKTAARDAAHPAGGTERVLVVEDEDIVRTLLVRMLEGLGYEVRSAPNGEEALGMLLGGERFDLVLTDIVMTGMSGRDLANEVGRLTPETKVLYMSGYAEEEVMLRGAETKDYLEKPFTAEQLGERIRELLDAA